jgi:hypothetical protein
MKQINILSIAVIIIIFSSCSTVLPGYSPNAPFLKEKGDVRLGGGLVLGGATAGGNVQVAVAASDHFYLGAGTSILTHTEVNSSFTDLSLGYFGRKDHLGYEFSAGAGLGGLNYGDGNKDKLTRFHGQAAAAYVSNQFQIGGGLRVASNSYRYEGKQPSVDDPILPWREGDISGMVSVEPFLLARAGGPKTSFQFMICYPIFTQYALFIIPDMTVSLGVSFMLGKKK